MTSTDRCALITGVLGQDGWYLARRLLADGWVVHGTARRIEQRPDGGDPELRGLVVHAADMSDGSAITDLVGDVCPTHIFNLAGSTSVARSWSHPVESADVLGLGTVRLLAAAWDLHATGAQVRFLQASSAEIFGDPTHSPQDEQTPVAPITPYGAAKAFAHSMVGVFRRRGMFASTAILYNHESPRRPETFVAAKIARAVAEISLGRRDRLTLGNVEVSRDWGYAPDYVEAMLAILGAEEPDDFVVATGVARSVRDFVVQAFAEVGIDEWEKHVETDPDLFRPADPHALVGDASRLRDLGWKPTVDFQELVALLVRNQIEQLSRS